MPGVPEPWFDDPFVLAPSYMSGVELDPRELNEGKSLGGARESDLVLMNDLTLDAVINPQRYAARRKVGVTVGRRQLLAAQEAAKDGFLQMIADWEAGKLQESTFRKESIRLMRRAWKTVFLAGLRSGGLPGTTATQGIPQEDAKFLKGAVAHEMRFLNKFLDAVVEGAGKMPYPRRVQMYIDTLTSFYESARVMSLPATSIIRWTGPEDKVTCASCRYLFDHNVYTRVTLPTTPRSGVSLCLSNCRDRLLVRRTTPEKALAASQGRTREQHLAALYRIKQGR